MSTLRLGALGWLGIAALAACVVGCSGEEKAGGVAGGKTAETDWAAAEALKGTDGQPLLLIDKEPFNVPTRPSNPQALPETDALHWYDMEYSGWNTKKENQPKSPGDG